MQCVFTGPPRVGKSSFWERVLGILPEKLIPSTDIISSERNARISIRGSCGFAVDVSEVKWRKLLFEEEMEGFVALVTRPGDMLYQNLLKARNDSGTQLTNTVPQQQTAEATPNEAQPDTSVKSDVSDVSVKSDVSVVSSHMSETVSSISSTFPLAEDEESLLQRGRMDTGEQQIAVQNLPSPSQVLEQALITMRQAEATKNIDSASFVYFTDTGGQPEFQEALPLLLAGSNTVLIIFNLEHDLHSNPPLEYIPSLDEPPSTL